MNERAIHLSYTIFGILIFILGILPVFAGIGLAIYYEIEPWPILPGLLIGVLIGLFTWGYLKFKWFLFIYKRIDDKLRLKEFIYKKNIIIDNSHLLPITHYLFLPLASAFIID